MSVDVSHLPGSPTQFVPPSTWPSGTPPVDWLTPRRYEDKKPLPALVSASWQLDEQRQAVLLALYGEVCAGSRALTDVRFKLLGLLPIASVAVLITLLSAAHGSAPLSAFERTGVSMLGLLFTAAVRLYDLRNTELYNDLVGRGRQIEAELGIHTGHFRGRPNSHGWIQHDIAVRAVYALSALGWLCVALQPWVGTLLEALKP